MQMAMKTMPGRIQMLDEANIYDYSYHHQVLLIWAHEQTITRFAILKSR